MMEMLISNTIAVLIAIIASSGFWNFLQRRKDIKDDKIKLLLALAQDKIVYLGMSYIHKGYMTQEEHAILLSIYEPYSKNGGNGVAKKVVDDCSKLPMYKTVNFERGDDGNKQ